MKINKREAHKYVQQEGPLRTLQELADGLGVSKERARQICDDAGVVRIKNLTSAMKEIRRLNRLLDYRQSDVVSNSEQGR